MTRQSLPDVCNTCGKEITGGMQYSVQYTQKPPKEDKVKGEFVKTNDKADQCHTCFLEVCKTGFKPTWIKMRKDEALGKWVEVEAQQKL